MSTEQIQILVTSDVHGYLMPTTYRGITEPVGLAKAASLIENLRQQHPTILIENGDLIQGSPLTYYHQRFHPEQPNPIINAANALRYDLAIFGNHEFNYGLPVLENTIQASHFPWLSANIYTKDGSTWMQPYVIQEVAGIRVGIIGITTQLVPLWEDPSHIEGLIFEDSFESAKKWLCIMKEQENVDITVLCYHGGFAHDLTSGDLLEPDTGENVGYQMCKELDFDIMITGHQHREICTKAFGKSIVQPGTKAVCIAGITIDVEMSGGTISSIQHEPKLYYVDDQTPLDERVVRTAQEMHDLTEQWLDEPIGHIHGNLRYNNAFDARVHKHPYIEFLQHVQMHVTDAPISCTSLFHDQPGGFNEQVTMRDIVTNYIYPNTLKVLQVTGQHIHDALEQCASYFTIQDGQLTIDPSFLNPKAQPYNYDMWEGIEYVIDVRQPVGHRILSIDYQGKPLDMHGSYEVAMNNYRATGAGNFPYFADCPVVKDIQTDMTEIIADYFAEFPVIQATCVTNWKVIWE